MCNGCFLAGGKERKGERQRRRDDYLRGHGRNPVLHSHITCDMLGVYDSREMSCSLAPTTITTGSWHSCFSTLSSCLLTTVPLQALAYTTDVFRPSDKRSPPPRRGSRGRNRRKRMEWKSGIKGEILAR